MNLQANTEESARNQIVIENMGIVKFAVDRMASRLPSHVDIDDLHSIGVMGLMDAIEKYDATRQNTFKTYAEIRVNGAIRDHLRSLDWVPRGVRQKIRKLEAAHNEAEQNFGRAATDSEVADQMGLDMEGFHTMRDQARVPSLVNLNGQAGTGEEAAPFAEIIEDEGSENAFASLATSENGAALAEAVGTLPAKDQQVLALCYQEDLTLKEIGVVIGVTEGRVHQIRKAALATLRKRLKSLE